MSINCRITDIEKNQQRTDYTLGAIVSGAFTALCIYAGVDSLSDPNYADLFVSAVGGLWGLAGTGISLYSLIDNYRN